MKYFAVLAATFFALVGAAIGSGAWVLTHRLHTESPDGVRMAQVRLLPTDMRSAVARDYIRRMPDTVELLVMGDSQSYGVDLPPQESLGAALRRHFGPNVFNVSIVDGRFSDQRKLVQILKSERKRARYLVFNINPSHFKRGLKDEHHLPDAGGRSLFLALAGTADPAIYVPFPNVRQIRNRTRGARFESVYTLDLYDQHARRSPTFDANRAPSGYYDDLDATRADDLRAFLSEARKIADTVVAFASPTYYEIYNRPPYDRNWDVRPVVQESLAHCRSLEGLQCLDLSSAIPPGRFLDVVHLDGDGHRLLATELSRRIRASRSPGM